jgi:hypothetical protein
VKWRRSLLKRNYASNSKHYLRECLFHGFYKFKVGNKNSCVCYNETNNRKQFIPTLADILIPSNRDGNIIYSRETRFHITHSPTHNTWSFPLSILSSFFFVLFWYLSCISMPTICIILIGLKEENKDGPHFLSCGWTSNSRHTHIRIYKLIKAFD